MSAYRHKNSPLTKQPFKSVAISKCMYYVGDKLDHTKLVWALEVLKRDKISGVRLLELVLLKE